MEQIQIVLVVFGIYYTLYIIYILKTFYIESKSVQLQNFFTIFILLRYNYLKYASNHIHVYIYTNTFTNSFSFNLYLSYFTDT